MLASRTVAMRNRAMAQNTQFEAPNRRRGFDIIKTIVQIANLLRAAAPDGVEICGAGNRICIPKATPSSFSPIRGHLPRLVHNAITIARQRREDPYVAVQVERAGATVSVRVADDVPGPPQAVPANLFLLLRDML